MYAFVVIAPCCLHRAVGLIVYVVPSQKISTALNIPVVHYDCTVLLAPDTRQQMAGTITRATAHAGRVSKTELAVLYCTSRTTMQCTYFGS